MAWLRDPLRLTVLYFVSMLLLGLPVVLLFDPDNVYGLFGGLLLGMMALLVPTGIYFVLPRRIGMSLFAIESFIIWVAALTAFELTHVFISFLFWSFIELPIYCFELLGLLEDPRSPAPRQPRITPLLLAWLGLMAVDYGIGYVYESSVERVPYPDYMHTVAYIYVAVPFGIMFRNVIQRVLRRRATEIRVTPDASLQ